MVTGGQTSLWLRDQLDEFVAVDDLDALDLEWAREETPLSVGEAQRPLVVERTEHSAIGCAS
jgi:hypothetical protein